ncbi:MAG: formate dehydrogenase accessory sulfurtransferase FdhD [Candidatus Caldatribacteriota bacterium]
MKNNMAYQETKLIRLRKNQQEKTTDMVIRESELNISFNGEKIFTLNYSNGGEEYLGVGFLFTEGFLKKKEEISYLKYIQEKETIEVVTKNINSTQKREKRAELSLKIKEDKIKIKADVIFQLLDDCQSRAKLFLLTGCTHSCALANREGSILLFTEDVSRYNTVDKILGEALLQELPLEDKIMIGSFRVTSGIFTKILRGRIPLIISRSAPTNRVIELAQKMGITLIGFAREERMNIYTYPECIDT